MSLRFEVVRKAGEKENSNSSQENAMRFTVVQKAKGAEERERKRAEVRSDLLSFQNHAERIGLPGTNSFQRNIDNMLEKSGIEKISSTIPAKNYVSENSILGSYRKDFLEYSKREDWQEKSTFVSSAKKKQERKNISDFGKDLILEFINGDDELRGEISLARWGNAVREFGKTVSRDDYDWYQQGYDMLNLEEKKLANYLYYEDKDKFWNFLKSLEKDLTTRGAKKDAEKSDGNLLNTVSYAVTGAWDRMFKQSLPALSNAIEGREEQVEPSRAQKTSQHVREKLNGASGFLYDAADSLTYMVPSVIMNGAAAGSGHVLTGLSAAGSAYNYGIEKGWNKKQARIYGALVGASEAGLSALLSGIGGMTGKLTGKSISGIVSKINSGFLKFISRLGISSASEFIEETSQDVLSTTFENIVSGKSIDEWEDIDWGDAVYSGLVGAFLGGSTNVVNVAGKTNNESKTANRIYGNNSEDIGALIKEGLSMPSESYAFKLATKLESKFNKSGKLTGTELSNLVEANEQAIKTLEDSQQKNTAQSGDIKFSIAKTSKIPYDSQLQSIENGQMNGSNSLYVGVPSESLQAIGFSNAPFAMNQSDYRKSRRESAKNKNYSSHSVPYLFFENMPTYISESSLFINNGDKVSIITDYAMPDTKGENSYVIVGVSKNKQMENDIINQIKSVYPLDDIVARITNAAESGNLVVTNKNKVENMLATIGIQPAEVSRIINLAKNSIPDNGQTVNNNSMQESGEYSSSDLQSTAEDNSRPAFTEPAKSEIYRPLTSEDRIEAAFGKERSSKQKQIESIAEKFGMTVYWNERYSGAVYSPKDKSIRMNPNLTLTQAYMVVFKHEFTHHLEGFKGYEGFKDYVFKQSNAFEAYVRGALEKENGQTFEGTREEAIKAYTDIVFDKRRATEEIPVAIRKAYTREEIEREIVADFTGEVLLFGENTEKSEKALLEVAETNRTFLQKIMDWIKDVISIIKGDPHNRTLEEDLRYLNQRIARVYDSAQKNTAKNGGEVKFSVQYEGASINSDIEKLVNKILSGEFKTNEKVYLNKVSETVAKQIYELTGINVYGFKVAIEARQLEHILIDHGERGKADQSLRDTKNIAKIEYVLNSPDKISLAGKTQAYTYMKNGKNKTADTVLYEKIIGDNSYYVVQAVADTKAKTLYIVTAFIGKSGYKKGAMQLINAKSPDATSNDGSAFTPNNSIPDNEPTVNNNSMQKSKENTSKDSFSVASEEFTTQMNKLTASFKEGKISIDEYTAGVSKLAENERKVSGELRQAMAEMEKNHAAQYMDSVRYMAQQKKKIYRQSQQLKERRSEISRRITEQREERASRQRNIEHIRKVVNRIDKALRTNSDAKHVPEEFKEAAGQFVKIFLQNDSSPFNKKDLQQIRIVYYDLLRAELLPDETETGAIAGVDVEMIDNLKMLANSLDGKTLRELNQYDLLLVRDIVDNFAHIISSQNEMFINQKREEIQQIGNAALRDISAGDTKRDNAMIRVLDKHIKYSNMTPIYFFDRMGDTFKTLFNDIVSGQSKWFRNIENSKTYISKMKEKYNYSKWGNDVLTLTTERGDKLEITREQALLLYATARREYGNKIQRSEHLFKGGVVVDRVDKSLKDAIKNFNKAEGKGREKVVNAFTEEVDSRAHQITPKDISEVFAWLTKEQINYADALVEYLSKDMAALGNEVSMQMVGITKFNEDYYIPYNSARNFLYSQPGVTNEARLKHQSFTKQTVVKANTPLILTSFSEVCADHINRMCMYSALTVPLENLNKIFNYKTTAMEGISSESVRAEIERVHGADAVAYIKQFIEDMNGNVRSSGDDSLISRWISKFKKGAVLASASVTIQQPSAIMRAMAHVDPKYFAKTTFKFAERDYQQAIMYASVAGIKDMGRFDTGTGAGTTQWLLHEQPKGIKEKVKAFVDVKDSYYRDETFSYFAAKADEITWAHIWAAVKAEVADKTDLKVGSDEYFERCGERFTEVINYTQVYDSTLSRSQIMRNKSTSAQMLTAFMSEPTIMLNNLMEAQNKSKNGGNVGKKECARIIGALVGNVLLNALLKSLVTAARDDDEDKSYLEKYLGDFTGNFASDISPFGMIPFVKDVISIFEGYTVERADMNLFSDLAQSIKTVCSEEKSIDEKIESLSGSLAAFLGLPVKNVLRDTRAAYNLIDGFITSKNKTTATGVKYEMLEGLGFDSSDSDKYEEMMRAADSDNEEKYQSIYKYLLDKGKTDSQIWTGIKKAYGDSKEVESEAAKVIKQFNGNKTFEALTDEDKEELEKDVEKSIASQKAVNTVLSKKEKFDNLYEAYRTNKVKYKSLKQQLIDEGLTETQVEDGLEVARLNYMKEKGIDIKEYLLFKKAKSNKYADTDNSGGVSNAEKIKAINNMDISPKAKQYFKTQHK